MIDDREKTWKVYLKQWTSYAGAQPKPIYVLEKTAELMHVFDAQPGDYMRLIEKNGLLHIRLIASMSARKSRQDDRAPGMASAMQNRIVPDSLVDVFRGESNSIHSGTR